VPEGSIYEKRDGTIRQAIIAQKPADLSFLIAVAQ
jgi:hypothetical protein